ncbi:hypothetical protein AB0M02_44290 [Actinoplanes sp. NPDC051861]|uniref:hypothetical protein n=1 Tax=Actinoplanes sp. NPDC051861 TaxID=3155170 RepID=UPI00343A6A3B
MLTRVVRHVMWVRRVAAARAWSAAERAQAAEHSAAVRRILAQAPAVADPAGRRR